MEINLNKNIGEFSESSENMVIPRIVGDTYTKLNAGKILPNNITVGDVPVMSVYNDVNGPHFGNDYNIIQYTSPFYYMVPYCLGSESHVKFTILRVGTSTANHALMYCGTTDTTDQFSVRQIGANYTLRDSYGTSTIDSISIPYMEVLEVDKNKNVTTIRNCKTGEVTVITHPVQVFRSDKVVTFGIKYSGTREAPTLSENCTTSHNANSAFEIRDYGKLLYKVVLDSKKIRFGLYMNDWHIMNLVNTTYKDVDGNIQTISPTIYKIRNKNNSTETSAHGIGKLLDVPIPPVGQLDLRNYTMMESLGFDVKDGSKYGYLDTGLVPNDFDGLYTYEIKVKDYGKTSSTYIGALKNNKRAANLYSPSIGSTALYLGNGGTKTASNTKDVIKTYKVQIHETNGSNITYSFWVDGVCLADKQTAAGDNRVDIPLYMFTTNNSGSPNGYYANIDVYRFKFWDKNGKLVFDGVPAAGPYEDFGIPGHMYYGGLFNKVDGTFKRLKQISIQEPI